MEISWKHFFQRQNLSDCQCNQKILKDFNVQKFHKNVTGHLREKICFLAGPTPCGRGAVDFRGIRTAYAEDCHLTGKEILGLLESWQQFLELVNPRAPGFPVAVISRHPWLGSGRAVTLITDPHKRRGQVEGIVPNTNPLPLQTKREVQLTFHALFHSKLFCVCFV